MASAEILVTPTELRSHASAVQSQAQDALSGFQSLTSRLQALGDQFRGQAATRFDEHYQAWNTSAQDLMNSLDGLGRFLTGAADTIEDVDTQLASGLG